MFKFLFKLFYHEFFIFFVVLNGIDLETLLSLFLFFLENLTWDYIIQGFSEIVHFDR